MYGRGTYDTWRAGIRLGGYNRSAGCLALRERRLPRAQRGAARSLQPKSKYPLRPDTSLALIFNQLRQPETQDPLGLTRAQVEDNPRQATPQAIQFDTRKTIYQEQLGPRSSTN